MKSVFLAVALLFLPPVAAFGSEYICNLPNGKKLIQDRPCPAGTNTTYANTAPPEAAELAGRRAALRQRIADDAAEKQRQEDESIETARQERETRELQKQRAQAVQRDLQLRQQAADIQEARLRFLEQQAAQQNTPPPAPAPRLMDCYGSGRYMHCQ